MPLFEGAFFLTFSGNALRKLSITTYMKHILLSFALLCPLLLPAQNDTIVEYDVRSQTVTLIPPQAYDTLLTSGHTPSSTGSLGNILSLSLTPPLSNLFSGSNFSDIVPAQNFFDVTAYPARTATRLFDYDADTLKGCCSGIFVANNFVLTATHCIRSAVTNTWEGDSVLIAPGYDNGSFQSIFTPSAVVKKYYIFKTYYDGNFMQDFALLQLDQPIGDQTGWVGMAFNSDSAYFHNKVFHKFSYPGVVSPYDPTKIYNGDTMYYNYGYINADDDAYLKILSPQAKAIPGQSGSSLVTDNAGDYYTFGTLSFSNLYQHFRITSAIFHALKNIIETNTTGIAETQSTAGSSSAYPNPFSDYTLLDPGITSPVPYTLALYNAQGQLMRSSTGIISGAIKIERNGLSSGLYFYRLSGPKELLANGKLVIR